MTATVARPLASKRLHSSNIGSQSLRAVTNAVAACTVKLSGISIPDDAGLRREPTRPPHLRDEHFFEKFDHQTLLYDAVSSADGRTVRLIAPALMNLKDLLQQSQFFTTSQSKPCPFKIKDLDRQSQIIVQVPPGTDTLTLKGPIGQYVIPVSRNETGIFAGHRVVFVQSKNNNLLWVRDWLEFYQKVHGADAVLFYDNGSDAYDLDQIAGTLGSVAGINTVVLVSWPFKHGPVGKGLKKYWDSDFSKLGMLEHARWRFLGEAKSALNCDIDELVMCRNGDSIFERVEKSVFGIESFRGSWVHAVDGLTRKAFPAEPLRFSDFKHSYFGVTEKKMRLFPVEMMRCQPKWAAIPARTPSDAQWHVHQIKGWWPSRIASREVRFRHFSEINTSWKYDRAIRDSVNSLQQKEDLQMMRNFKSIGWL